MSCQKISTHISQPFNIQLSTSLNPMLSRYSFHNVKNHGARKADDPGYFWTPVCIQGAQKPRVNIPVANVPRLMIQSVQSWIKFQDNSSKEWGK